MTSTGDVKVLLVDDRDDNLVALEAILGSLDLRMVHARSGEEALKALLTDEFAVILLDVMMPGMDGFETAGHIKSRDRTKAVPIIFLTGAAGAPGFVFRSYAVGAVDYLTKPFDPWILRAKVAVFVDLYRKNRQLHEQADLLRTALAEDDARPSHNDVVGRFAARIATVEEHATRVRTLAQKGELAEADFAGLDESLTRLRTTLDALRTPLTPHARPSARWVVARWVVARGGLWRGGLWRGGLWRGGLWRAVGCGAVGCGACAARRAAGRESYGRAAVWAYGAVSGYFW